MKENKTEKKVEKEVVKLNALDTLEKFIAEIKSAKNEGTEEGQKYNFEKVLPFCQITWAKTSKVKQPTIENLKPLLIGKIQITLKKEISDVCIMFSVRTARGLFSCKVIREIEPYKTDVKGCWGVNPLWYRF